MSPLLDSKDSFKFLVLQAVGVNVRKLQVERDKNLAILIRNEISDLFK